MNIHKTAAWDYNKIAIGKLFTGKAKTHLQQIWRQVTGL